MTEDYLYRSDPYRWSGVQQCEIKDKTCANMAILKDGLLELFGAKNSLPDTEH